MGSISLFQIRRCSFLVPLERLVPLELFGRHIYRQSEAAKASPVIYAHGNAVESEGIALLTLRQTVVSLSESSIVNLSAVASNSSLSSLS